MTENTTIIIHSRVAIGYVGSNTTSFVLQMSGYEVITVPTVLYSNHLGYPTVGGGKIPEDLFSDILKGILNAGNFKECFNYHHWIYRFSRTSYNNSGFHQNDKEIKPRNPLFMRPCIGRYRQMRIELNLSYEIFCFQ